MNQDSQNSSRPPGSELPWAGARAPSEEEAEEDEGLSTDDGDAEEEACSERLEAHESGFTGGAETVPVPPPRRKPGKQAGAPGYGREQALAVHGEEHHHPERCACCDHPLGEGEGGSAYTAVYTLDIPAVSLSNRRWGEVERPGITVVHTKHFYHETACGCGHRTRAVPCRAAPDALLPGIALSQWRLVGPR